MVNLFEITMYTAKMCLLLKSLACKFGLQISDRHFHCLYRVIYASFSCGYFSQNKSPKSRCEKIRLQIMFQFSVWLKVRFHWQHSGSAMATFERRGVELSAPHCIKLNLGYFMQIRGVQLDSPLSKTPRWTRTIILCESTIHYCQVWWFCVNK